MEFLILAVIVFWLWRKNGELKALQKRVQELEHLNALKQAASLTSPKPSTIEPKAAVPADRHLDKNTPAAATAPTNHEATPSTNPLQGLMARIQSQWMLWLGGFCVALAGVYLAKYAIERGFFGPVARITLGVITGLSLHVLAEFLRRKTGSANPTFAALAGGGSITLFAIVLVAFYFYQMLSAGSAFTVLAVIAVATLWLALIQGPALAIIGLLGAYTVPLFVSDPMLTSEYVLLYTVLIMVTSLTLVRIIYRHWLLIGSMLGVSLWWLIAFNEGADRIALALTLFGMLYSVLAIPDFDWLLQKPKRVEGLNVASLYRFRYTLKHTIIRMSVVTIVIFQAILILNHLPHFAVLYSTLPLLVVLLVVARQNDTLVDMPWLMMLAQLAAVVWFCTEPVNGAWLFRAFVPPLANEFGNFVLIVSLLSITMGLLNFKAGERQAIWSAFITVVPFAWLAALYYLSVDVFSQAQWLVIVIFLAALYFYLARIQRNKPTENQLMVWLVFTGQAATALAAAMLLQDGQLTVALAIQLAALAWLIGREQLANLGWVLKLLVAIVIVRLSVNPWLIEYSSETHWTLLSYGGSFACCLLAVMYLRSLPELQRWAEGAALHLFTLFVWAELRYWIHDGDVFASALTAVEAGLSVLLFGALSIVYFLRSKRSESLMRLYKGFSYLTLALFAGFFSFILVHLLFGSAWLVDTVSGRRLFNILWLYFAAPAAIGWLGYRYHHPSLKIPSISLLAFSSFIFINLQIKHFWQGSIAPNQVVSNPELYTYSVVWLGIALAMIIWSAMQTSSLRPIVYRAGLAVLVLVILKIFFVDMSGLQGLYRVASLMGLGLSLLGLSYLHQQFGKTSSKETP